MTPSILDHLLDPLAASFSQQQTERVLAWRLDPAQQKRLDYLREQANEGQLSEDEEREYHRFIEDLDVIATIQAKARQAPSQDAA